uniref:Amino acid transporter transmembrane domain-containing protein n=2 Tax=Ditylum brightwellii TaxID=49249 RepID=A0A7S4QQW1_9STRA
MMNNIATTKKERCHKSMQRQSSMMASSTSTPPPSKTTWFTTLVGTVLIQMMVMKQVILVEAFSSAVISSSSTRRTPCMSTATKSHHRFLRSYSSSSHSSSPLQFFPNKMHEKHTKKSTTTTITHASITSSFDDSIPPKEEEEELAAQKINGGSMGVRKSTFNLMKGCLGSGLLALPSGIARIGNDPSLILPSSVLILVTGLISAYTFFLIGRLCRHHSPPPPNNGGKDVQHSSPITSSPPSSLGDLWTREIGSKSSWVVSLSCCLTTAGVALAYSIILGDMLSNLAVTLGASGVLATRQVSILAASLLAVYPLCSVQSLAFLSPFSAAGVCGLIVTCAFMGARLLLPNSPYALPTGAFLCTLSPHLRPIFKSQGAPSPSFLSPPTLVLTSMAATGYLVHFTAPEFYNELKDNTLTRFGKLTSCGFLGTAIISIVMMSFGYLTFGGSCAGMILNNYSTQDVGAAVCRFFTAFSLIGTYPFMFGGLRSAFFQLAYDGKKVSEKTRRNFTRMTLTGITCLALVLKDAGFVVSLIGALMGSAIIYIFPSMLFLKNTNRRMEDGTLAKSVLLNFERIFNKCLIGFGLALALLGGGVSVISTFFPHML